MAKRNFFSSWGHLNLEIHLCSGTSPCFHVRSWGGGGLQGGLQVLKYTTWTAPNLATTV